ncbi:MAG: YqaA family protein [Neisseria sp.]|uniref:YqaA family protein n=1 Tax=Neisseria sp. TaxID=192066 RepID=UPI0026DD3A93|nr:YqaA family protein [Neisseria sp.]MDO4640898.1 YqaA family protein [Neisseria sp.]
MDLFWQYAALFFSALTSATVLPGSSEVALGAMVRVYPQSFWLAFGVAAFGNTLGSIISYGMGRLLPQKYRLNEKAEAFLKKYGVWALLLAWVPFIGDALPVAAGWLRLPFGQACLMLAVGKCARYGILLVGLSAF